MDLSALDRMALRTYSSLEKQSMYQLLCATMKIDGHQDPREEKIVEEVVEVIGLTSGERQASRTLTEPTMTNALRSMDVLKKCYLAKFIAQIVLADGVIDERENMFVNYYFAKLDIPQM